MSDQFKSLRHPSVASAASVWRYVSSELDLSDLSVVPMIVSAPSKSEVVAYGNTFEEPARQEARLQVLFSALSTYAKAIEAAESAELFRMSGRTASSLLLSYDAAYFAARSLALFLGFSPVSANSEVMVDVFSSYGDVAKDDEILEDNFSYFVSGRWDHMNVWALVYRIIGTIKRTADIENSLSGLRKDKLKNVSNIRNKQSYSGMLYAGDLFSEADFPMEMIFHDQDGPSVCKRYRALFENLAQIVSTVIEHSKLQSQFRVFASENRLKLCGLLEVA